jgi:DNA-binding MarR family transcriptional regulator
MQHYDARSYKVQDSIGYLMRRGAALMRHEIEGAFVGQGLSFVQWVTLIKLRDEPTLTAGDLCRDLQHDSGAFTRVLDHLEQHGLIGRERSESDRRVVQLVLTADGRRAVQSMLPIVVDRLNYALQDFSAAEVTMLAKLLRRLMARLDDAGGEPIAPARKGAKP